MRYLETPRRALMGAAMLAAATPASAQTSQRLVIGTKLDPSSMDPHYFNGTENLNAQAHVFECLIGVDTEGNLQPMLAESWRSLAPRLWEIRLRRDVRFHDGQPFTADDVILTFARIPKVESSPGSFVTYVSNITRAEARDPHTLHLETATPDPFFPRALSRVFIIPASLGEQVKTADFNNGRAAIGTGPYRLVQYRPSESIVMARNPDWWGGQAAWEEVVLRPLRSDGTRAAALLARDVDMIDFPAAADLERMRRRPELEVMQRPGARVMYIQMDHAREVSPFAQGPNGKNPLQDARVRRALSIGVDRRALTERLLDGSGTPAGQMPVMGQAGSSGRLRPPALDPGAARALLAEAGVAQGFRLTIHGTSDRYPSGDRVVQTLAQYYSRLGIDASVQLVPNNVFYPAASRGEYSFFFLGYASEDPSIYLRTVLHSNDAQRRLGSSNRGRYSNPRVDALIRASLAELDDAKRNAMMAEAFDVAEGEDVAVISLYHPTYDYIMRRSRVSYQPHTLGRTWAMLARPTDA